MGLYNAVVGENTFGPLLLHIIGFELVPRWCDCWLRVADGEYQIVVFTRTGGKNRVSYSESEKLMREHSDFVEDWDEPEDTTYAHWAFKTEPTMAEVFDEMIVKFPDIVLEPMTKFNRVMVDIQAGKSTPATQAAIAATIPVMEDIKRRFESGEKVIVLDDDTVA